MTVIMTDRDTIDGLMALSREAFEKRVIDVARMAKQPFTVNDLYFLLGLSSMRVFPPPAYWTAFKRRLEGTISMLVRSGTIEKSVERVEADIDGTMIPSSRAWYVLKDRAGVGSRIF